jgi:hypothetical protein
MTAQKFEFETTRWEPLITVQVRPEPKPVKDRWEFRHYLVAIAFVLLIASPFIWAITRNWIWGAMSASMAMLLFFVFALLVPSSAEHANE